MQPTLSSTVAADMPFRLQVVPDDAVAHPAWRRARAAALAALDRGEAVLLLGPPGTGKTLLLRDLAQALRQEGRSVQLVERGDAPAPASGTEILLIDEAAHTGPDTLARLCATGMPFVLAALPGFAERLAAGLARPATTVALEPLPPEEVARFVAARLSAAGRPGDLLGPDAVLALTRHSAGLPRLVNALGGAAVFLAELEGAPRVGRHHVDEAAAMRGGGEGEEAAAAPTLPPEPIAATAPRAEASVASRVPRPAWWRRAALGVAAAGLGLVLAGGGWAVSGWRPERPSGARTGDVSGQPPEVQPGGDRGRAVESARDDAGSPAPSEGPPAPPQPATRTSPLPLGAGTALRPRPVVYSVPVVAFRGPVYNETKRQGGRMSLLVRRQGPSGAVTARVEAQGGLLGSGKLAGHLSEDGRLWASGQLMMGKNPVACDLSGLIAGDRLTGSASFVRSGGGRGRVARSRFTLTRSEASP